MQYADAMEASRLGLIDSMTGNSADLTSKFNMRKAHAATFVACRIQLPSNLEIPPAPTGRRRSSSSPRASQDGTSVPLALPAVVIFRPLSPDGGARKYGAMEEVESSPADSTPPESSANAGFDPPARLRPVDAKKPNATRGVFSAPEGRRGLFGLVRAPNSGEVTKLATLEKISLQQLAPGHRTGVYPKSVKAVKKPTLPFRASKLFKVEDVKSFYITRMAAKSRGYHKVVLVFFSLFFLCGAVDDGTVYLDEKEASVRSIARSAEESQANCGNLDGCKNACTRAECYPVADAKFTGCYKVGNNELCGINGRNTCKRMLLDYGQAFTTLPPPGDIAKIQPEVARDICLQKGLEPTYKNVSKPFEYSVVYYGSVSGASTAFPGRESNCSTPYETRKRPWYLDGINVKKELKILIDVGQTMGREVTLDYGSPRGYTYLRLAQDTVKELLQTFTSQDYVEVIAFDSKQQTSLGGPVEIKPYYFDDPTRRPELASLLAKVEGLVSSSEVSSSDLDGAVSKASSSFVSARTPEYLKVIIVLTNGLFAPLNTSTLGFPSKSLRDLRAKLMVYKLKMNQNDPFLTATPSLKANLCAVNGSFEVLEPQAMPNPLYAMRSYFTYLARIHLAVVDKPYFSNIYQNFNSTENITSVTYPAFGSDSLLIGVASIDIAINDLSTSLKTLVQRDLPNRSQGILSAPATFPMTCDYQAADRVAICPNSNTSPSDVAVCMHTDTTTTLKQRTCCDDNGSGTCTVPEPVDSDDGPNWKKIGPIVGVVVGVVVVGGSLYCFFWCRNWRWQREVHISDFEGDRLPEFNRDPILDLPEETTVASSSLGTLRPNN